MPNDPNLPTNIASGSYTAQDHRNHHDTEHAIVNKFYKATIGATRTASFSVPQSVSGEVVPVSSISAVDVLVPALAVGTVVELVRTGTGTVHFTPSGVSFVMPADVQPDIRAQGGSATLLWLTSTQVLLAGELTRV